MRLAPDERRCGHGQALVECALVLGVLVVLVFSIFDLGRAFMCYHALNEAAALAAEYGTGVDNVSANQGTSTYPSAEAVHAQARSALGPSVDHSHISTIVVNTQVNVSGRPALRVDIRFEFEVMGPLFKFAGRPA